MFIPQENEYPFSWQRRQFPVKPAFATTINKAQGKDIIEIKIVILMNLLVNNLLLGQTMKTIGIWLRSPVFAHGQLYVACSRVGRPSGLKFAIMKKSKGPLEPVVNVVYKEVLNS